MTPEETIIVADQLTSMKEVLTELGYDIWKTPQQISCPVHKLGNESRPSARIYEDDRVIWCFYCLVQYKVTEVWAAMKDVDRSVAAGEVLTRWPASEDQSREVLSRSKAPYKPRVVEVYQGVLERYLVSHRKVARFDLYRKWTKACDEFMGFIVTLPKESQQVAIQSFIERLNGALSSSY